VTPPAAAVLGQLSESDTAAAVMLGITGAVIVAVVLIVQVCMTIRDGREDTPQAGDSEEEPAGE
jgi:hypothetical protein